MNLEFDTIYEARDYFELHVIGNDTVRDWVRRYLDYSDIMIDEVFFMDDEEKEKIEKAAIEEGYQDWLSRVYVKEESNWY